MEEAGVPVTSKLEEGDETRERMPRMVPAADPSSAAAEPRVANGYD